MEVGIGDMFGNFLELPLEWTFDPYELWVYLRLVRAGLHRRVVTTLAGARGVGMSTWQFSGFVQRLHDFLEREIYMSQDEALAEAGRKLRSIRESKGLSQEALSLQINMDQSNLSKVERLGPHLVSWAKFLKLASALGCVIEVTFKELDKG
jgi:hypothetical protein